MHRTRFVRHRLEAGTVLALANLPNERTFRKQREHILHSVLRSRSEFQSLEDVMMQRDSQQKQTRTDVQTDCSRRGGLTMIGSTMETSITMAMTWSAPA